MKRFAIVLTNNNAFLYKTLVSLSSVFTDVRVDVYAFLDDQLLLYNIDNMHLIGIDSLKMLRDFETLSLRIHNLTDAFAIGMNHVDVYLDYLFLSNVPDDVTKSIYSALLRLSTWNSAQIYVCKHSSKNEVSSIPYPLKYAVIPVLSNFSYVWEGDIGMFDECANFYPMLRCKFTLKNRKSKYAACLKAMNLYVERRMEIVCSTSELNIPLIFNSHEETLDVHCFHYTAEETKNLFLECFFLCRLLVSPVPPNVVPPDGHELEGYTSNYWNNLDFNKKIPTPKLFWKEPYEYFYFVLRTSEKECTATILQRYPDVLSILKVVPPSESFPYIHNPEKRKVKAKNENEKPKDLEKHFVDLTKFSSLKDTSEWNYLQYRQNQIEEYEKAMLKKRDKALKQNITQEEATLATKRIFSQDYLNRPDTKGLRKKLDRAHTRNSQKFSDNSQDDTVTDDTLVNTSGSSKPSHSSSRRKRRRVEDYVILDRSSNPEVFSGLMTIKEAVDESLAENHILKTDPNFLTFACRLFNITKALATNLKINSKLKKRIKAIVDANVNNVLSGSQAADN